MSKSALWHIKVPSNCHESALWQFQSPKSPQSNNVVLTILFWSLMLLQPAELQPPVVIPSSVRYVRCTAIKLPFLGCPCLMLCNSESFRMHAYPQIVLYEKNLSALSCSTLFATSQSLYITVLKNTIAWHTSQEARGHVLKP